VTETAVFGATGQAGAQVVRSLVEMGIRPRVFKRSAEKATSLPGSIKDTAFVPTYRRCRVPGFLASYKGIGPWYRTVSNLTKQEHGIRP